MGCTRPRRRSECSCQGRVELTSIGKPGEAVLIRELADLLFRGQASQGLPLLFAIAADCKHEQPDCEDSA